jgi:hypothetical protein
MNLLRQYIQSILNARKLFIVTFLLCFGLFIYAPFTIMLLRSVGKDWFGKAWIPPTLTLDWPSLPGGPLGDEASPARRSYCR